MMELYIFARLIYQPKYSFSRSFSFTLFIFNIIDEEEPNIESERSRCKRPVYNYISEDLKTIH